MDTQENEKPNEALTSSDAALNQSAKNMPQLPPQNPQAMQKPFLKKLLKLSVIAAFCAFFLLIANHYYYLKDYAENLSNEANVIVFIDKASKDDAAVCDAIEALNLAVIDEYVHAKDVYAKAVEENPFLKDVSVQGMDSSFQSYVKISPKELPTEEFMADLRNQLYKIEYIDDVIFDAPLFKHYSQIRASLIFYEFAVKVFALLIFAALFIHIFISLFYRDEGLRHILYQFVYYLFASVAGFLSLWTVCLFYNYKLLVNQDAVFIIIPIAAALGIIYKD